MNWTVRGEGEGGMRGKEKRGELREELLTEGPRALAEPGGRLTGALRFCGVRGCGNGSKAWTKELVGRGWAPPARTRV